MREMELTIFDVTELNRRMKFLDIAKQHAPVGKEKLREALKQAGATFDQQTKRLADRWRPSECPEACPGLRPFDTGEGEKESSDGSITCGPCDRTIATR